jgi:DNA-binding beta-propeller fold protein YncE
MREHAEDRRRVPSLAGAGPSVAPLPSPRAALIVVTGVSADRDLPSLKAPARDAEEMAAVLGDPAIGAFEVTSVINLDAHEIKQAAQDFLVSRNRDGLVLVYLSCHGVLDDAERLYFAAADTRKDRLASTAVEAAWLLDQLDECATTSQILIADCCFSGALTSRAEDGLRLRRRARGHRRAILTASSSTEKSWEGDSAGELAEPSVFTGALVRGLRTKAADTDADGSISAEDAYQYAREQVADSRPGQAPQLVPPRGSDKLWLVLNPARPPLRSRRGPARTTQALSAAAAVAVIVVTALVYLAALPHHPSSSPPSSTLPNTEHSSTSPPSATTRARVYSGESYGFLDPAAIAVDGAHIWVTNTGGHDGSGSVTELNASDGSLVQPLYGGNYSFNDPVAIAADGADIWVANYESNSLTELSASDGSLVRSLSPGSHGLDTPSAIAADGADIWVANYESNSLTELNASDGSLVQTLSPGSRYGLNSPSAIAVDGSRMWVANSASDSVTELNASNGTLIRALSRSRYGFDYDYADPEVIAADGTHVWVANYFSDSVTELNANDGSPVQILHGFDEPTAITVNGAHIWIADSGNNSVTELNASDGSLVQTLSGGDYAFQTPEAIAVDGANIWVVNHGGSVTEVLDV